MPDPDTTATPDTTPAAEPSQEPQSVAVSTPQTVAAATPDTSPDPQPTSPSPQVDFKELIPEQYRDKPYMKEVDSLDKMFADFDNAQQLIGQRQAEIPGKDATEEQITAYLDKIRPESTEAYTFPETEYSKKFGRDENFGNEMKSLFQKAGLFPWQVNVLAEGYDAAAFNIAQAQANADNDLAADFEKLADGHFGDQKDAKIKIANEIMKIHTPDNLKPFVEKLSNESLMLTSAILNSVFDKYMSEDDLNIGGKGTSTDGGALQKEAQQLMATPAYKDFRHPDHDATVQKVNELYDQVGKVKKD